MLGLDAWWDEPAYKAAQGTLSERGTFILNKLAQHDAAKLSTVIADLLPGRAARSDGDQQVPVADDPRLRRCE